MRTSAPDRLPIVSRKPVPAALLLLLAKKFKIDRSVAALATPFWFKSIKSEAPALANPVMPGDKRLKDSVTSASVRASVPLVS